MSSNAPSSFEDRGEARLILDLESAIANSPRFDLNLFRSSLESKDMYGNEQVSLDVTANNMLPPLFVWPFGKNLTTLSLGENPRTPGCNTGQGCMGAPNLNAFTWHFKTDRIFTSSRDVMDMAP